MPSWAELKERQQQYMQAIYETDQEQEADGRSLWKRGGPYLAHVGYSIVIHWIHLRPFGEQFYRDRTGKATASFTPRWTRLDLID